MPRRDENPTLPPARTNRDKRPAEKIEQLLAEILSELAAVLVSVGYGISGLNRLTRRAYFEAAKHHGARSSGKLSIAKIAAQTGLTRVEVSQLSREGRSLSRKRVMPLNRAHRLSIGWQSDPRFCKASGEPYALPFSGRPRSFSALSKQYSGDIPARAMLLEMKRLRMVTTDRSGTIRLVRTGPHVTRRALTTLGAISPWIRFLANDLSRQLSAAEQHQITLKFASAHQAMAAIRELNKRTRAFLTSVDELGANASVPQGCELDVAIAFAASMDSKYLMSIKKR